MSFSALLSGYAKSKSEPPVETKKVPVTPKPHALKEVLTNIRLQMKPTPAVTDSDQPIQRNLGILVTIIDDFPNELLWRLWLNKANADNPFEVTSHVRMWFHAKCPEKVRSPWVRERLIQSAHFKPEWGSIEITKAMAHMLHEALFDAPHINKFCFASESCIPIRSLSDTLDIIYSSNGTCTDSVKDYANSSWLNYSHIPNNGYAKQLQHDPLSRALPDGCVYKASQWVMLSREHAMAVIELMQQVSQRVSSPSNTTSGNRISSNQHSSGTRSDNSGNSGENDNGTTSTPATAELPILSNALFNAFQLVGKASDEMFFPSCLAVVGAIEPFAVEGETSNPNPSTIAVISSNSDPTAATTTSTVTSIDIVYKQQITYCDWTDNAKSPQEYFTFPTALVTALTQYKHYSTTAKNKKLLETLHIHPEQQYACFLRKIKFPMDKGLVQEDALCEVQMKFLSDWLPFIVENNATISREGNDISAVTTTATGNNMLLIGKCMQQAQILYSQIGSYPMPEKVIKKRPLVEEHSDSYSRSNGYNGNDNKSRYSGGHNQEKYGRDGRYSNDYSDRQGGTNDRSYGHNDEYRNDYNDSSNRYRRGNDRYGTNYSNDRSRDYRDSYANKSSRYY